MILYFSLEPPHRWAVIDSKGRFRDSGIDADPASMVPSGLRVKQFGGVVPGDLITLHRITAPTRNRRKALDAIPYLLEEELACDVDTLMILLLHWNPGQASTVAVVSREVIEGWKNRLLQFPFTTISLIPDYLMLPNHPEYRCTLALDEAGDRVYIREDRHAGLVLKRQMLDLWWEHWSPESPSLACNSLDLTTELQGKGADVQFWDIGSDFDQWCKHGDPVSRRPGIYRLAAPEEERSHSGTWFRAALAMLALSLTIRLGMDGYEFLQIVQYEEDLDEEIAGVFNNVFPNITRIVDVQAQMQAEIDRLQGNVRTADFQVMLQAVATAVPVVGARVEEISFEEGSLLVTCSTSNFEMLQRLHQAFSNDNSVKTELTSSGSRDNSVSGRFRLTPVS